MVQKKPTFISNKIKLITKPIVERPKNTEERSNVSRVDMSVVFMKLKALSTPYSIQRGKIAIYRELQSVMSIFTSDKEFMTLVKDNDK